MKGKILIVLLLVVFLVVTVTMNYGGSRKCRNCGQGCDRGSCDISSSCAQCKINSCWDEGSEEFITLNCNAEPI